MCLALHRTRQRCQGSMSGLAFRTQQCCQGSRCTIKIRTLGPFLGLFYRLKQTLLTTRREVSPSVAPLAGSSKLTRRDTDAKKEKRACKMALGAAAVLDAGRQTPQTPLSSLPPLGKTHLLSMRINELQPLLGLHWREHVFKAQSLHLNVPPTRGTSELLVSRTSTRRHESLSIL